MSIEKILNEDVYFLPDTDQMLSEISHFKKKGGRRKETGDRKKTIHDFNIRSPVSCFRSPDFYLAYSEGDLPNSFRKHSAK